jgi:hypothetical protein
MALTATDVIDFLETLEPEEARRIHNNLLRQYNDYADMIYPVSDISHLLNGDLAYLLNTEPFSGYNPSAEYWMLTGEGKLRSIFAGDLSARMGDSFAWYLPEDEDSLIGFLLENGYYPEDVPKSPDN